MYEDLEKLVQLKFIKQMEAIAAQTRENVVEAKRRFAATASPGIRSGPHDADLARLYIEGAEQMVRSLFQIWVDLIKQLNGYVARADIPFVAGKIDSFAQTKKGHLRRVVTQQGSGAAHLFIEQADRRMLAAASDARRDLELMVREHEVFPNKARREMESMKQATKKRFSVGRRVLVGMGMQPGTVQSVADAPSTLGEFVHEVLVDGESQSRRVLGSELQPLPDLDEDLRGKQPVINIHSSNVGNLNVGSQVGIINTNLQTMSKGGDAEQKFAQALEEITQAIVSEASLSENQKQEAMQAIATLSQEATKKPEERSKGTIKALVGWLPTVISTADGLVTLWNNLGPSIRGYLGI